MIPRRSGPPIATGLGAAVRRHLRAGLLAAALLTATAPPAAASNAEATLAARFGNDAEWYRNRIPLFESSDPTLDAVYYYRWQIVRAHQRDIGAQGYITTEFLDDVSWQREPYASLNDATGFHLGELRWMRDRRFAADYVDYMYRGGNDRHFSDYMADAVWSRYLVDGDRAEALRHLSAMRLLFGAWDDHLDFTKGLYWIEPLLDATEYTISSIDASGGKDGFRGGDAFRPSINAYMFANARALSQLSMLAGDEAAAADYAARAEAIKAHVQRDLWNPAFDHFIDRYKVSNDHVRYWEPIRGRELVGYVPWAFDLPDDDPRYAAAWRHLLDPDRLAGPAGLRTVEPSYPHYMRQFRYEGTAPECQWNGPVWPFQTTQVLAGMINLLDHYKQSTVTRNDFLRLLRQYARLHYQGDRLDLEEDYDPATGKPIVGLARSHHYFHSGFIDLMMTGLVGIRPRADDMLEVNPLIPASGTDGLSWFRAEGIPYHGRTLSVTWDADGRHYGRGAGLRVEADGKEVARRADLGRIVVPLARVAPSPIARPIDRAVQLVRGTFPRPSASSNPDPEALHDAIDGRVWFFPEMANGWTSAADDKNPWFAVEFEQPVALSRAELAFFADGRKIAAPAVVRLQSWDAQANRWVDVARTTAVAPNGITHVRWREVRTSRIRVASTSANGHPVRLVELKLF